MKNEKRKLCPSGKNFERLSAKRSKSVPPAFFSPYALT